MARRLYPTLGLVPVGVDNRAPGPESKAHIVHGKKASLPEYNVAQALEILGFEYFFQYYLLGGRLRLGGIVLDFLVWTKPWPTPVPVQSRYYHSGANRTRDILQLALIDSVMAGELAPPVEVWEDEVIPLTSAIRVLRERLL